MSVGVIRGHGRVAQRVQQALTEREVVPALSHRAVLLPQSVIRTVLASRRRWWTQCGGGGGGGGGGGVESLTAAGGALRLG
eukprot:ctg_1629.g448